MLRKRFLFLIMIVSVGFGLLWIEEYTTQRTEEDNEGASLLPDYYGEGLKNRSFDSNGVLNSQFEAQRSVHFPGQRLAELTLPKFTTTAEDGEEWVIKSLSGTHFEDDKKMILKDDVVISPLGSTPSEIKDKKLTTIRTSELTLFTQTKIAKTDQPVEVIDVRSRINAVGMIINIDQKRVEFLSQVNSKYEP